MPIFRQITVIQDDKGLVRKGGRGAEEIYPMQEAPLMPKATAVWLVENTALSFDQVAEFCKLHPLEVKAIADGDAAQAIKAMALSQTGHLSREESEVGLSGPLSMLMLKPQKLRLPEAKK